MTIEQRSGFQLASGSVAESYERFLVPVIHAPWAAQLLDLVALQPGERVLDIACGTGIAARLAAERVDTHGAVTGVDANEGMLGVARTVSSDLRPAVDWRHGDAADLPFPDGAFDAVVCQQALQFFQDRPAAVREMHRVLASGGRVALSMWRSQALHPVWAGLDEAIERHVGAEAGAAQSSPFPECRADELRELVATAGFTRPRVRVGIAAARFPEPGEFLRQVVASSPLAGPVGALDTAAYEALVADLRRRLADHTDDDGLIFAMQTYLVDARRA